MYIPQHTRGAIDRYILDGIPTGDFMYNVLVNDLNGAVSHADKENSACLANIVGYIHNYVPNCCHGSREKVANWIKAHKEKAPIVEQAKTYYKDHYPEAHYEPKLCICCEEITEENAHIHRNCGK